MIEKYIHEKRKNFSVKNHNPNFFNQISYNERTISLFDYYNFKIATKITMYTLHRKSKEKKFNYPIN